MKRPVNPCLGCGACCAFFRASFPYREADDLTPGGVPVELTDDITQFYRAMKGTDAKRPRCVALDGEIGRTARCGIHPARSSTCRDFPAAYVDGSATPHDRCDRAREAHGLPPLRPEDW